EALLTSTSIPPSASAAAGTQAAIDAASARSQVMAWTRWPPRAMSARASSRVALPRAHSATSAPAAANCDAIARPMPRLAPATRTRLPVKSKDIAARRLEEALCLPAERRADQRAAEADILQG